MGANASIGSRRVTVDECRSDGDGIEATQAVEQSAEPLDVRPDRRVVSGLQELTVVGMCAYRRGALARHSGGIAEALMALFAESTAAKTARLTASDSFIATGPAYAATLPSTQALIAAAQSLTASNP